MTAPSGDKKSFSRLQEHGFHSTAHHQRQSGCDGANCANHPVVASSIVGGLNAKPASCTTPGAAAAAAGGGGGGGRNKGERSTKLLVGIVVVFLVCHVFRLAIQVDVIVHPTAITGMGQHSRYCEEQGLFYTPFSVYILTCFNNFCLVLNSSINFVVYCMVGRRFRSTLVGLFRGRSGSARSNNGFKQQLRMGYCTTGQGRLSEHSVMAFGTTVDQPSAAGAGRRIITSAAAANRTRFPRSPLVNQTSTPSIELQALNSFEKGGSHAARHYSERRVGNKSLTKQQTNRKRNNVPFVRSVSC